MLRHHPARGAAHGCGGTEQNGVADSAARRPQASPAALRQSQPGWLLRGGGRFAGFREWRQVPPDAPDFYLQRTSPPARRHSPDSGAAGYPPAGAGVCPTDCSSCAANPAAPESRPAGRVRSLPGKRRHPANCAR